MTKVQKKFFTVTLIISLVALSVKTIDTQNSQFNIAITKLESLLEKEKTNIKQLIEKAEVAKIARLKQMNNMTHPVINRESGGSDFSHGKVVEIKKPIIITQKPTVDIQIAVDKDKINKKSKKTIPDNSRKSTTLKKDTKTIPDNSRKSTTPKKDTKTKPANSAKSTTPKKEKKTNTKVVVNTKHHPKGLYNPEKHKNTTTIPKTPVQKVSPQKSPIEYLIPDKINLPKHKHAEYAKSIAFKIHGNISMEYYYINIYVGNPPQKQSVIIDTGSDFTAFPCNLCSINNCGHHENPWYDQKTTKSISSLQCDTYFGNWKCVVCQPDNQCGFERRYAESVDDCLKGPVYVDEVTVGDGDDILSPPLNHEQTRAFKDSLHSARRRYIDPIRLPFGCTVNEPSQFKTQLANGIMGFTVNTNSYMQSPNIIDQLVASKQITTDQFSICFGDDGGIMTLGGFNTDMHLPGETVQTMEWIQYSQYHVNIFGMYVNKNYKKNLVTNKGYKFMIDSGTTYLWFPPTLIKNYVAQVNKYCKEKKDLASNEHRCLGLAEGVKFVSQCIFYNTDSGLEGGIDTYINSYPVLQFKLGDQGQALLNLYPREWLAVYNVSSTIKKVCPVFRKSESDSAVGMIGNQFMKHYDFNFDRSTRKIRFVRSYCDEEARVKLRKD